MSSVSFLKFKRSVTSKSSSPAPKCLRTIKNTQSLHANGDEMRSVFNKFDANKDGKISEEEYRSALRVMGGSKTGSDTGKAFREADSDGDGFIDFEEFVKVHNAVKKSEIEGAFRVFDLDGNGKISAAELLDVMKRMGERCDLEACRKMIGGADGDGDGMINMEFMTMMTRTMKLSGCSLVLCVGVFDKPFVFADLFYACIWCMIFKIE